jgi:hypothetical protein
VRAKEAEARVKTDRPNLQGEDEIPFWRARFSLQQDDSVEGGAAAAATAATTTAAAAAAGDDAAYEVTASNKPKRGYKEDPYVNLIVFAVAFRLIAAWLSLQASVAVPGSFSAASRCKRILECWNKQLF